MNEINKTKKLGIILLHGITKSKEEFSTIKSALLDLNFYIETPNLPKHGLCPREFKSCWRDTLNLTREELLDGVTEKFLEFRNKVDEVIIGGNSLGANLAFYLAKKYPVKGIIAINPVYQLTKGIDLLMSLQPKVKSLLLGKNKDNNEYHNFNLRNVVEIIRIAKESPKYVLGLSTPTLLIFSKKADLTSSHNAGFFIRWIGDYGEVHWIDKGGHGISKNQEIIPIIRDFCINVQKTI